MEFNAQNLEYAVSVFYNSEQQNKYQAHQWLTTAQRSPEAWSFVWELLQTNKSTEVQFFASTTLHTKICKCWMEVPEESHEELKDKILQAIFTFSKGPKIVLNRLCISLAAYILQQTISDLATILRPLSSPENMSILLEVLTVIPDEFTSMTMGTQKRIRNKLLLKQACPAVLDDMLRHLQSVYVKEQPDDDTMSLWIAVASCSASWLSVTTGDASFITLPECIPICNALLQVVHHIFISNEAVSDSGLEACEAALSAVRAAGTAPDACKYPSAAIQLMNSLAALAMPILARDNVPNSINEELVGAILTCAVGLGDSHSKTIVNALEQPEPNKGVWQFLQLLLAGQGAPGFYPLHETRSQFVFGFWCTLQDELLCYFDGSTKINEKWRGLFSRLLNVLIEKSEAPSEENMSRDDAELLRCYRQDITDAVMYCFGVLADISWNIINAAWSSATTDAKREAVLHVFLAMADAETPQPSPILIRDMLTNAIQTANTTNNARLLNTSLECLGAYASWLSSLNVINITFTESITRDALQACGSALQKCPQAAALSLKKLSTECSELAAPLAREITAAAQDPNVTNDSWVRRQLLGAAGATLAASELSVAAPLLNDLADMLTKDLVYDVSVSKSGRGAGAECAAALLLSLSRSTCLGVSLFRALLPALPPYADDPMLVPSLFTLLRQALIQLMDDCLPFLDNISELAERALSKQPCANGIEFITIIAMMFDKQWHGCSRLLHFSLATGARVCAADPAANCDITQALFSSLHKLTKKKPHYIDSIHDILPQLIDLGYECMKLWESNAARAACWWIVVLIEKRPQTIQYRAPDIVVVALRCIGGAVPRHQVEPLAEILLVMNRAQWDNADLAIWLRQALQPEGFPTIFATNEYKQKFITAVLKEKSNKRRLFESVQEFSLVCRGMITTEYAKESLSSKLAMP